MFRNIPSGSAEGGVTGQRHGKSTGTKFPLKGTWGHPAAVISEGKNQETGEEVKGSQSKTANLHKLDLIQHEVCWQKLKPAKISQ